MLLHMESLVLPCLSKIARTLSIIILKNTMGLYWLLTLLVVQEMLEPINGQAEPECLSKFETDYKIIQELILLRQEVTALNDKITKQEVEISTLTQEQKGLKKTMVFYWIVTALVVQEMLEPNNGLLEPECLSKFEANYKIIQELVQMRQEMTALNDKITKQDAEIKTLKRQQKASGSTYIRWGRTICPDNDTTLVYSGFMAGSNREQTGTGSNYICLTGDPLWDYFTDTVESLGKITGVEYQFWNHKSNGASDFFGEYMYNHNAPCVVCHSKRSVSLMIPGRNRCYDGWTKEYIGYLVSGNHEHKGASEYVCLDRRPEKVVNGDKDDEDNRLYFVEGVCGKSLACPPYVQGREITCVVCTL